MLIAHYIGDHASDTLMVRLGWAATRLVQRGIYKDVTHCEAILGEQADGAVAIASATLREGGLRKDGTSAPDGVRIKHGVRLDPAHWLIADVPIWSAARAAQWFGLHEGEPYDLRGAWASALPGHQDGYAWFCNEAVAASVGFHSPHSFGPAQWAAITFSIGRNITSEFFARRGLVPEEHP